MKKRARRIVVAVAPNGGSKTRADHPRLPIAPDELARTAAECLEEGAAMLHLHVRDSEGVHLLDADAYRAATARIRAEVGDRLVVQITSESMGRYSPARQMAVVLDAKPEAASLAIRELAPEKKDEPPFGAFLERLKWLRVWPQFILYTPEEARRLAAMQKAGLIPFERVAVLYGLGRFSLLGQASPSDLLPFLAPDMPRFASFSVCAFGRREAACLAAGALFGGHARVGFENNFALPDGRLAASNAELVRAVTRALAGLGMATEDAEGLRAEIEALMS